jgi:hypothetical protein
MGSAMQGRMRPTQLFSKSHSSLLAISVGIINKANTRIRPPRHTSHSQSSNSATRTLHHLLPSDKKSIRGVSQSARIPSNSQ